MGVERFRRFIADHKNTPAAVDAVKDLQLWEQRRADKLVKAGPNWVTAEQYNQLLGKTVLLVQQAREEYKQGRQRDVEATINTLLALDANNISALYLRGLLLAKQDQTMPARKAFERVLELASDHGPSLNNVAVLCWQQTHYEKAMGLYEKAMAASPRNRQVLDNVAEALHAIPERFATSAVVQKAKKRFEDQDADLQKELAEQGLHRWGATYYTEAQMQQVKAEQAKIDAKKQALKDEYDRIEQQMRSMQSAIDLNIERMRRIESDRWRFDNINNVWVEFPLPNSYWQTQRETDILRRDLIALRDRLATYPQKMRQAEQTTPLPAYTGKQRLIEAEGTPLKPPQPVVNPTTQPAK